MANLEYKNGVLHYGDLTDFFGYQRIPVACVSRIRVCGSGADVYIVVKGDACFTVNTPTTKEAAADKSKARDRATLKQFILDWEAQYAPKPKTAPASVVPETDLLGIAPAAPKPKKVVFRAESACAHDEAIARALAAPPEQEHDVAIALALAQIA